MLKSSITYTQKKLMTRNNFSEEKDVTQLSDKTIHIVGPRLLQNELMVSFLRRETGAKCTTSEDVRHIMVKHGKDTSQPKLILLDCLEKDLDSYLFELESSGENALYHHFIALFNVRFGLGIEEKALRKGIRGFFYVQDPLERFPKGLYAIFKGEMWASRAIMAKTILECRNTEIIPRIDPTMLTSREIEILTMVAVGAKNEEIAENLFISPNTVKTHIYNIFKKINVPNRLQAALWAVKNL
jgi:DNA-binding NarL/FixJ family response regulator